MTSDQKQSSPVTNPLLVVISAPSGGGKTTLCHQLLAARPDMTRAITCTTRDAARGRKGWRGLLFSGRGIISQAGAGGKFSRARDGLWQQLRNAPKSEVLGKLRAGKDVLLNVDVQGAATIRKCAEEDGELKRALVTVFLTPPTLKVLEERLRKRGTDTPPVIQKRLGVARQEIAQWKNFDYLLISHSVAEDLAAMQAIVEAEKMRTERSVAPEF